MGGGYRTVTHFCSVQFIKISQHSSQLDTFLRIHVEEPCSCAANRSQTDNVAATENEMLAPSIFSRMKQPCHFTRIRIKARQVRAFVKIAVVTGPRQIHQIIRTTMLSGNNVFYLEGMKGVVFLVEATIFAPIIRALPEQFAPWEVGAQVAAFFKCNRALACRMAIRFPK